MVTLLRLSGIVIYTDASPGKPGSIIDENYIAAGVMGGRTKTKGKLCRLGATNEVTVTITLSVLRAEPTELAASYDSRVTSYCPASRVDASI